MVEGLDETVRLDEAGVALSLRDIYDDLLAEGLSGPATSGS
jgi:hypothetical protein